MFATPAGRFRLLALAEAASWAGLLIGMLFKYVVVGDEIGVKIFGPVHGGIFIAYVLAAFLVRVPLRWNATTLLLALVAGIPPFGTLVFERWATRTGRLDAAPRPTRA